MSLLADLKVLYHLTLSPIRGRSHAERLDNFYRGQAAHYDHFRNRLLQGRQEMLRELPLPADAIWIDMGGGTGHNLEMVADQLPRLRKVYLVDLAGSLLQVAQERIRKHGWHHVEPVLADATSYTPPESLVDTVTFSYSLTMIPDWFAAIDHAYQLLRPGGYIGVVDFYVSRKHPEPGRQRHGWFARNFWPIWFAADNVFLSSDHVPYLFRKFEPVRFTEHRARVPYLFGLRVPYYRFIGRKPPSAGEAGESPGLVALPPTS